MATRHQVRQAVITFLYAYEMGTFSQDFASEYFAEQKIKNEQKNFAQTLFGGVLDNLSGIDERINAYLSSFKLKELGAMERAILRLGAHEILAQTCEARVAISEAVALASEFGSESGVKLVNGVLDNISKAKTPAESRTADTKEFFDNLNAIQESLKPKEISNSRIEPKKESKSKAGNSRIPKEKTGFKTSLKETKGTDKAGFKKPAKSGFKTAGKTAGKTAPKRAKKDEK